MYSETADGYPNGSRWSISLNVENEDSYTDVVVGDEIVVYYDGMAAETDPLEVSTVYSITLKTPADRLPDIERTEEPDEYPPTNIVPGFDLDEPSESEQVVILPNEVKKVEVSGYYNGGVINAGDFVVEDFDIFAIWVSQLSLEHRTFAEGKTPGEMYAGWNSYTFDINGGELTFTYNDGGTMTYVIYDEEWYEVLNPSEPPFK